MHSSFFNKHEYGALWVFWRHDLNNRYYDPRKFHNEQWAVWEPTCFHCGYKWVAVSLLDHPPSECPSCDYEPVQLLYPCDFEDMEDYEC